jgi:hypothetical protein
MEVPAVARALAEDLARSLGVEVLAFDEDGTLTLEFDDRILVCAAVEHGGETLALFAPVTAAGRSPTRASPAGRSRRTSSGAGPAAPPWRSSRGAGSWP